MAQSPNFYNQALTTNDLNGATNRARVAGSAFTVFTWAGNPIAFARQISTVSQAPVGTGTVPIHPLDETYPQELITAMALTMGEITLELYELYGAQVWERLQGLSKAPDGNAPVDLAGIFMTVANTPSPIMITRIVRPPMIRGKTMAAYTLEFHNCVVSSIVDGETIEVGSMEVLKQMTVNYTHTTRGGKNNLLASEGSGQWRSATGTTFG